MPRVSIDNKSYAVCFDAPPLEHREAIRGLLEKRARGEPFTAGDINFLLDGLDMASNRMFGISIQTRSRIQDGKMLPTHSDEAMIARHCLYDLDELATDQGLLL